MNHVIAHMRVNDSLTIENLVKDKDVLLSIKNNLQDQERYLNYIDTLKQKTEEIIFETPGAPVQFKEFMKDMFNEYLDYQTEWNRKHIRWLASLKVKKKKSDGVGVTTDQIEQARNFPVEDLLDFNRGNFTNCPYHNEKTPSMKFYKESNTCYCFGCHKKADAIDIYRVLNGVDFTSAVRQLIV